MFKSIILCSAITISSIFGNVSTQTFGLYSKSCIVVELNEQSDTVTCEDFNGEQWEFGPCEDWAVGDIVALTMYDNGTASIYDDIILQATYCGYIK